jgi:uncharacterized membrane protein
MSDERRIESLEAVVRSLAAEVAALREEVRARGGGEQRSAAAPPHRPLHPGGAPTHRRRDQARRAASLLEGVDLEMLLGRYGTMALAALLTLMGVGAILTWAASRGLLGPTVRLAFGVAAAIALALVGVRLRARGARRYGDTLLAIALAVVHVDAWGAGPYLGIVHPSVALALAALASAALAALAIADGSQWLFVVGVGGALAAPFVTSTGRGDLLALLGYGWLVITISLAALRGRDWSVAPRLLLAGAAVYASVGIPDVVRARSAWWLADAPAIFAIACAWSAWGWSAGRGRLAIAPGFLVVAVGALLAAASRTRSVPDVVALSAAVALSAWAMSLRRDGPAWAALLAAVVLPLASLVSALSGVADATSVRGALLAGAWLAGAMAMAYADERARRGRHLAVAAVAAIAAALLGTTGDPLLRVGALVAAAAAATLLVRREEEQAPLLPILLALVLATMAAFDALARRPAYEYAPFLTRASLAALTAVAGWVFVGRVAGAVAWPAGRSATSRDLGRLAAVGVAVALLWGRAELARAWSADAATFALIVYYAVAGVAAIFVGRWRALPLARRVGLALAIFAALKAVTQASGLTTIGLKVGSYLLVGLFLLAVAYWYRAAAEPGEAPATG